MSRGRPRKIADLEIAAAEAAAAGDGAYAMRLAIAARLDAVMKARGISASDVAHQGGVSLDMVYAVRRASKDPGLTVLDGIARGLGLNLADLVGGVGKDTSRPATTPTISIRGGAADGVWMSMAMQNEARGTVTRVEPQDERYRGLPQDAVEILNDHLMGLSPPIHRGEIAIYADLRATDIALESGRIYLIYRINSDGLIERTFRRLTVYRDRYELELMSPDPVRNAREKIVVTPDELARGDTISVSGILIAVAAVRYV
jgi:transcriptional regulator with XRE-family HTH domain